MKWDLIPSDQLLNTFNMGYDIRHVIHGRSIIHGEPRLMSYRFGSFPFTTNSPILYVCGPNYFGTSRFEVKICYVMHTNSTTLLKIHLKDGNWIDNTISELIMIPNFVNNSDPFDFVLEMIFGTFLDQHNIQLNGEIVSKTSSQHMIDIDTNLVYSNASLQNCISSSSPSLHQSTMMFFGSNRRIETRFRDYMKKYNMIRQQLLDNQIRLTLGGFPVISVNKK